MLRLAHILVDRVDVLGTIVVPDFIHRRMVGQHSDRGCPLSPYPLASSTTTISPFLYALEHYMPTQLESGGHADGGTGVVGRVSCMVILGDTAGGRAVRPADCWATGSFGFFSS
jgi:hypothetical protein